jgi:protein-disulfide isomerase
MGVRIFSHALILRIHPGKHPALQPGRFVQRDVHRSFWLYNHSDAFIDILLNDHRYASYLEKETFQMKKQYIVLISIVLLVLAFVLGSHLYKQQRIKKYDFMAQNNASTFVREHSLTLGSDDSKVYLVEFSDPACETCAAFHPFVKKLIADNPGKIKLVVRHAPFHEGSENIVKILEAARKQGRYWEALEELYRTQSIWASHHKAKPELVWQFLTRIGLDLEKIRKDVNDPDIAKIVRQDLADAETLNVQKTPGFFVNGKPLARFGRGELKQLVESEIREYY